MSFFDRMKDSFTVAGAEVNQKVSQAAEALKINNKIRSNDKEIDQLIYMVGAQCVERHLAEEDTEYDEFFDKIRFYKSENKALEEALVQMEREGEEKSQQRQQEMKERQEQREQEMKERHEQREQECQETVLDETTKRCQNCGQINDRDARFCVNCGTLFAEEGEE